MQMKNEAMSKFNCAFNFYYFFFPFIIIYDENEEWIDSVWMVGLYA